MAAPSFKYEGNPDFRGWVSANIPFAKGPAGLLSVIGNKGKINWGEANKGVDLPHLSYAPGNAQQIQNYVSDLYNQFSQAKGYNDQYNSMLAGIAANRTPVPRFINYDIGASWDKARKMAAKAVSPVYQQKMTDFIKRQGVELQRQRADTTSGKEALDLALERLLGDTQIQRTRTGEDVATNIADINATQKFGAREEGLDFEAANRALTEGIAASGLGASGLGRQQVRDTQRQRREMSNEQVRRTLGQVEAQNTLMTRTFQDLEIKEGRGREDTTTGKKKLDIDLERFIQDQAYEKDQTKKELELKKQADIAQKSVSLQDQLVDQWIQSLTGKGYTAQEIANAAAIYG